MKLNNNIPFELYCPQCLSNTQTILINEVSGDTECRVCGKVYNPRTDQYMNEGSQKILSHNNFIRQKLNDK